MEVSNSTGINASTKIRWDRITVAKKLTEYQREQKTTYSQRQSAETIGVARSTLQYWLARKNSIEHNQAVIDFFESPDGIAVLHQLVNAILYCVTQRQLTGNRGVCEILKLSRLDRFVASSYGSIQKMRVAMETGIVEYGKAEEKDLAVKMPKKSITLCEDETFHPNICLVAIEPVSNYILCERYSEKRDAQSWNSAINDSLKGLNVNVIQSTSDEGTGILKHVKESLNAHHSPDIFHVQQEISKGTSGPLTAKIRQVEKALEKSVDSDRSEKIKELEIAQQRQKAMRDANKNISEIYHPYDLMNGTEQTKEIIKEKLDKNFEDIEELSCAAQLGESAKSRIKKAKRVLPKMLETILFFWTMVNLLVKSLNLDPALEHVMRKNLIPILYLKEAAKKSACAKDRDKILKTVTTLTIQLQADPRWSQVEKKQKKYLKEIALQCAHYFQRSSSCVEGRNGQLSRYHHSLHRLSNRTLQALTIIHNYHIKRSDGSTAAERFFENKPNDLFDCLLNQMEIPMRPARKRQYVENKDILLN